jgi:hypothetical protein
MFVDPASRYIRLKKNQIDAQFIFSTFRQTPLHVLGVIYSPSSGGTLYGYNNWYLLFFLDDCLLSWLGSKPARTTDRQSDTGVDKTA